MDPLLQASLMNQSLMSQSLSDLRNPGYRNSGEWRMFSSDSDIKDIAEGEMEGGEHLGLLLEGEGEKIGSKESISTLKNPSGPNTAQVISLRHGGEPSGLQFICNLHHCNFLRFSTLDHCCRALLGTRPATRNRNQPDGWIRTPV